MIAELKRIRFWVALPATLVDQHEHVSERRSYVLVHTTVDLQAAPLKATYTMTTVLN